MINEVGWRLGCFVGVLAIMMLLEQLKPARKSPVPKTKRWFANFGLVFISSLLARLSIPIGLTAVALYNIEHHIGLFNLFSLPLWLTVMLSIVLLDLVIYWQHRLFHQIPLLWRLHKVHHADSHIDTSTGLRFHPIEIGISIIIKLCVVSLLGVPAVAVLIFEIALNGLALFNHANIRLPKAVEKYLRLILVTQVLHRIHHSQAVKETNSNYGFSVIWWDKLFGSYKSKATQSDADLSVGLIEYPHSQQNASLWSLLIMPFKNK